MRTSPQLRLMRNRSFSSLWTAGLISMAGDWLLGVALSSAVNLLDLPTVVLGGHLAPLAPLVDAELRGRVLTAKWAPPTIRASTLGSDAAIIGAARTVTQAIIDDPAAYLTSIRA